MRSSALPLPFRSSVHDGNETDLHRMVGKGVRKVDNGFGSVLPIGLPTVRRMIPEGNALFGKLATVIHEGDERGDRLDAEVEDGIDGPGLVVGVDRQFGDGIGNRGPVRQRLGGHKPVEGLQCAPLGVDLAFRFGDRLLVRALDRVSVFPCKEALGAQFLERTDEEEKRRTVREIGRSGGAQ